MVYSNIWSQDYILEKTLLGMSEMTKCRTCEGLGIIRLDPIECGDCKGTGEVDSND